MNELTDAFHQMKEAWTGRESEFTLMIQQLHDAKTPEARQKIMEEQ